MKAFRCVGLGLFVLLVSLLAMPTAAEPREPDSGALTLQRNLPRDPLLVVAFNMERPAEGLGNLLDLVGKLGSQELKQRLAGAMSRLDAKAGLSVEHDLLSRLGPQIVVALDLPPIDGALMAFQSGNPDAFSAALGGVGLYAEVREAPELDRVLRRLLALTGGEVVEDEGIVAARIPLQIKQGETETGVKTPAILQYSIRNDRIALGFSRDWIRRVFESGQTPGTKLPAGRDFAQVFAQLDSKPTRLTYLNLPKARDLVRGSQIVTAMLESHPRTRELLRLLSISGLMDVGLGATSVAVPGGVRTTNFGPDWLAGAVLSSGLVAVLAVPALIVTQKQDGDHRTLEDIRSIAAACEGFSTDTHAYPPAQGWVPVERIALYLEPIYIASLPRKDAWEHPLLYWSDGASYRIISTGRDGQMDRDWSGTVEPGPSVEPEGDIVFGDGQVLVGPPTLVRD